MIPANELRAGNYVIHKSALYKVVGFTRTQAFICFADKLDKLIDFELIDPIPLTVDLLLKSGFVYDGSDDLGGWKIYTNKMNVWNAVSIRVGQGGFHFNHGHGSTTPIFSIHQLQNLCFALTGEELEIKL